ncbi:phosphodiester glycosidase family protein [Solirubrobacter sp. CPCC 204708]|uniref:Phosphodiester glycosidase family protein n=1 Tax=Solirubrobacter deserti TaxID=2282478 RepID=A0ABT4RMT7_9ACTN|nr:phosphodiester glycosidase family protein [Solirubrobacter deserti]MBE2320134.1 phosphodiester glycosidase family protein [Solirubrobacter deserti]MDA0139854.1 phosphodiester glycosidase family protein [Solirubrobacter deserti]
MTVAVLAVPSSAAAAGLALTDDTERIGPGVTLRHLVTLSEIGWTDAQILEVDLHQSAVRTDLLTAGPVARGSALSAQVREAGAVAGVNGDFFDINNSNAAIGPEILSGAVRKSGIGRSLVAGVSTDRLGRLANLTLQASATLPSGTRAVRSLNDPTDVGANNLAAYTPLWGTYSRMRGVQGSTNVAEVIVTDGKVASINPTTAGAGELPANSFALVGREAGAEAIRALQVGDAVSLAYDLKSDIADQLTFAVGGNVVLVQNGIPQPAAGGEQAPRTAIGFKNGGKTLMLVTADGRQSLVAGPTVRQTAELMADLGAETALNLDGGGSTTMVARPLGNPLATVRNTPSDGSERADPNGVGVFVAPGDGTLHDLVIAPADARVFPGMRRTFTAAGLDDHDTPVPTGELTWTGASNVFTAPNEPGTVTVTAKSGSVEASTDVRVLGKPVELEPSALRLSYADPGAATSTVRINGRDADGFTTGIDPADLTLEYDNTVLEVTPVNGGLRVDPIADGATILTVKAAGLTARIPVTVGAQRVLVDGFDTPNVWNYRHDRAAGGSATIVDEGRTGKGMKITYDFTQATATRSAGAVLRTQRVLAGQPLRASVWVKGDGNGQWVTISLRDAANKVLDLRPGYATGTEWTKFSVNLPATGVEYPVRVDNVRLIETSAAKQYKGSFILDDLEVEVPAEIATPAAEAAPADRLVSRDGDLSDANWTFAALSDVQFTAAAPDLSRVAIAALKRIRQHNPDFVVLNGDIVDTGYQADVDLAKQTLEAGGCDMVETGAPGTPTADTVPCLYVPGNHESYGTDNLNAWKAVFGDPYRTFDHKGVRFVLLNSTRGTFRGSDYAQLPMLQQALESAADDASVKRVVVFAHHPTNDPDPGDASQLGDRKEVQLIEKLLSESSKPAMMVGSHAQIVNVDRIEGVPYMVLPSSGKSPYGTPDRGGFTGWVRYGVSDDIKADVRAFAQSVGVSGPDALAAGSSATLGGELVQPNGVATGTRKVPLRYPMSVRWKGSDSLQLNGSVDDARKAGKVAVLNTATRELTAVRAGEVTVTAEADSMRDGDDLAPITGSKTIVVGPYVAPPVEGTVGGSVPATLALTLGTAPTFPAFVPGVDDTYEASTAATVTSTAGEATLSVSNPGHLTNGAFQLAQPLETPNLPKTFSGPVTNDTFAIGFRQTIAKNDPLRTGTYSRTLTFTLATSTP